MWVDLGNVEVGEVGVERSMRGDGHGGADEQAAEDTADRSVGPLELFFGLVFAMSQVMILMLADISWAGFGRGFLALAAVWWAWVCYAWLTNTSDHAGHRLLIFLAMAAMLVAAVALPQAFGAQALVFGIAFLAVRLIHVALLALDVRGEADVGAAVLRLVPTLLTWPALLVAAAFVDTPGPELLWIAAAVVGFSVLPAGVWRLPTSWSGTGTSSSRWVRRSSRSAPAPKTLWGSRVWWPPSSSPY